MLSKHFPGKLIMARHGLLVMFSGVLTSCGFIASLPEQGQSAYAEALCDAAIHTADKVRPLRALPSTETVTMVSWVGEAQLPCSQELKSCTMSTGSSPMWVTVEDEVQSKCRQWNLKGTYLRNRLEQLLGLPMQMLPELQKTKFIELQVKRSAIERPCLGVNQASSETVCTLEPKAETSEQVRQLVTENLFKAKLLSNSTTTAYPFTGLGYTYDWGASTDRHHYGATEFWIMPNSNVTVSRIVDSNTYCN